MQYTEKNTKEMCLVLREALLRVQAEKEERSSFPFWGNNWRNWTDWRDWSNWANWRNWLNGF